MIVIRKLKEMIVKAKPKKSESINIWQLLIKIIRYSYNSIIYKYALSINYLRYIIQGKWRRF